VLQEQYARLSVAELLFAGHGTHANAPVMFENDATLQFVHTVRPVLLL
jgi:hypothetical protein